MTDALKTTPLEPFDGAMAGGQFECEMCEDRTAVGHYGDAYVCQECYDEAEAPYREIERLRRFIETPVPYEAHFRWKQTGHASHAAELDDYDAARRAALGQDGSPAD